MLDILILITQFLLGLFFAISGFHKLIIPARHETLVHTLEEDHIPMLWLNEWLVPFFELAGGAVLLTAMVLNVPHLALFVATGALFTITAVACVVDAPKRVQAMLPINFADRLTCWLYLCEIWLLLGLAIVGVYHLEQSPWMMLLK